MFQPRTSAFASAAVLGIVLALAGPPALPGYAAKVELIAFAGTGGQGYSGDGGQAAQAQLSAPSSVAVDPDGTVYIADAGNRVVRAVAPNGEIRTVAGTTPEHGVLDATPVPAGTSLSATEVTLKYPTAVAVGRDHTVYIADSGAFRVLALSPQGRVSAFAGTGRARSSGDGGPAVQAEIGAVKALAVGPDGTVYLGDLLGRRVRAVTPDGIIRTVMGNGDGAPVGGGAATEAGMENAASLAVDESGSVWVTSTVLQRVQNGRIATATWTGDDLDSWALAGSEARELPKTAMLGTGAVAASGDMLYVLDSDGLRRLRPGGAVDMVLERRGLVGPLAVGASGKVYVVDDSGNRVFVAHPPAPNDPSEDDENGWGATWRSLAVAAGIVTVIVAVICGVVRRRRGSV